MYLLIYVFIYLPIDLLIYLFIYLSIYLSIYLLKGYLVIQICLLIYIIYTHIHMNMIIAGVAW